MSKKKYVLSIVILFFSLYNISSAQTILTDVIDNIFNYDLYKTSQGADVLKLQRVLNLDGDTVVSCSGVGSAKNESDYFGPATEKAVIKFQKKYNVSPADGYVGQKTRDILNYIYRCLFISNECQLSYQMADVVSACTVKEKPVAQKEELSICKLVDLLIAVDAIKKDKIDQARSVASQFSSSGSCGNAFVDLKINDGERVSLMTGESATLSWKSNGVKSCKIGTQSQNASGTQVIYPYKSDTITITCLNGTDKVSDSVEISMYTDTIVEEVGEKDLGDLFDLTTTTELTQKDSDLCIVRSGESGFSSKPIKWMASTSISRTDLIDVISYWEGTGPTFASSSDSYKTYIKGMDLYTTRNDKVTKTIVKATYKTDRITFTCTPEEKARLQTGKCNLFARIWDSALDILFMKGKCSAF